MSIDVALRYWLDQALNHGPLNSEDYKLALKALSDATFSDQPDELCEAAIRRWAEADKRVSGLPDECYLIPDKIPELCSALRERTEAALVLHNIASNNPPPKRESSWVIYPLSMPTMYDDMKVSHPLLFATETDEGTHIRLGYYHDQPGGFIESGDPLKTVYTSFSVRSFYEYPFPPTGLTNQIESGGDKKIC